MSEEYEWWELRPGELTTGGVAFGSLPYDLAGDAAEALHKEREAKERKRQPVGFWPEGLPQPKPPKKRRRKRGRG